MLWGVVGRLERFPQQGEYVRLVEAPAAWMEPFVGWRFIVTRHSRFGSTVRLRADYQHTTGGPLLELVIMDSWLSSRLRRTLASYFEGG